jgi:DNA-binding NarL/FixJ family response regulator
VLEATPDALVMVSNEGRIEMVLRHVTDLRPDVVLLDIHLEGSIDGIETATLIAAELQIPVIYLTAYSDADMPARTRLSTPYGYLLKPFTERELHATIRIVLARRSAVMALRDAEHQLERQSSWSDGRLL